MSKEKKVELTAADIWKMFAEVTKSQAEVSKAQAELTKKQAETDRLMKETNEQMKRTDEKVKELCAETNEQMKRTDAKLDKLCGKVGGIDDNLGHHAEQFFQDTLAKTLTFGGEKYDCMIPNLQYVGKENGEFDIVLVNGKNVAIIEAKNRIHPSDVTKLTEKKIVAFRKYFPKYNDCKVYLGLAGFSFSGKVIDNAKKHGIGIIKQVGKSIEIEADKLKAY